MSSSPLTPTSDPGVPISSGRLNANVPAVRAAVRLASGLILLSFVLCHFTSHVFLLISIPFASGVLAFLMTFWWTPAGGLLLGSALTLHFLNALWSIFARRTLHLLRWEWAQLSLGFLIPPLMLRHVIGTRIAAVAFGTGRDYESVLVRHWALSTWYPWLHITALLIVWAHAGVGIHFWLRHRLWYRSWRRAVFSFGVLLPTLAVAGYVAAGNFVRREAERSGFVESVLSAAGITPEVSRRNAEIERNALEAYLFLLLLPFAGRALRDLYRRRAQLPVLSYANGLRLRILPGANVLEVLRASSVPHASVCGGRARCTTCRVRVVDGLERLHAPSVLEAKALARIAAPANLRLACQIRPTSNLSVVPLLPASANELEGLVRGGLEGREAMVTVVFLDLRNFSRLGESNMPYDVLFVLNRFFAEMSAAIEATGGHYSQFTGDGLMALYGLESARSPVGTKQALLGAQEMRRRLTELNRQIRTDLQMGIGIHYGEAIVGSMGPPGSQILTAIGDTVNKAARLEGLTKELGFPLIISRQAAAAADLDLSGLKLQTTVLRGQTLPTEFYALEG